MKNAAGILYTEQGAGSIPIVCLHGIGGDANSFEPQLNGLSDNHRVISWCMPGYRGSISLEPLTFESLAAKLCDFLDALGIQTAHLCGQSIGGMIAMEACCLYPNRVASLALIGTTSAFGGRDESFREKFVAARLKPLDDGMTLPELAVKFAPEITGPIASPEAIKSAINSMAAVPEQTYRQIIRCLVTFNRRDDIENFKVPVCLIAGDHDQNAPATTMARMAEKIRNAEYHEVQGAGHLINLEAGDETNRILQNFYEKQA